MLLRLISILLAPLMLIVNIFGAEKYDLPLKQTMVTETTPEVNNLEKVEKVVGVNDSSFYISYPDKQSLNTVHSNNFGMSPDNADNTAAFQSALDYCADNTGTVLKIDCGKYFFRGTSTPVMDGLKDIYIDGSEAEFIFTVAKDQMVIRNCDCIEIYGLSVDWDRDNDPIADVVRVKNADASNNSLELEFFQRDNIDENMKLGAITECDPETLTFGANKSSKEVYIYSDDECIQSAEKVSSNVLKIVHNGCMKDFRNGDTFILRHYVYGGSVFSIGGNSSNLTFDHVNIYGSSGVAYYIYGGASHFRIINGYIGSRVG